MAPAPEELSAPGAAVYSSDTMVVGDGTWSFSKNTFLMPNLVSPNFETMQYNGMGNRFSTLVQYHGLVKAHAIMGTMIFLFIVPFSVMIVRFYSLHPGYAVVYHAQLQVFAALMLLVVFILGFFAVGPERNLSNPHHGIGVAIFVLFALQIVGGRLVRHITKSRSLRIMIHQWSGRAIALLGIVQVPLGLTLYGSPKYCFILYALWMSFLVLLYFILSYRQAGHRERIMMSGGRSEAGHSRLTESEYMSDHKEKKHGGIWKWLGPIAAIAGIWALMRKRKEHKQEREDDSYYASSRQHDPQDGYSRRDSYSYYDEKESAVQQQKKSSGGGFLKILGGAAAAIGAGKLASNLMNRGDKRRDDEYSAVSTDTPRRHRPGRSEVSSDYYSDDYGRDRTELTRDSRTTGPTAPGASYRNDSRRDFMESDYSSYADQSRRDDGKSGAMGKGLLAGLGMGWLASKFGKNKARKEEDRLREEEEMRAGNQGPRFTGDGHPSPTRRDSRRPPPRRTMGYPGESALSSDFSESALDARTADTRPQPSSYGGSSTVPIPMPVTPTHGRTGSRRDTIAMPPMPSDPHGILHSELDSSAVSSDARPQRRASSRRRAAGDKAAAAAAARASSLAADEEKTYRSERERYASPSSQPVSVKLKVHDDRDRNVTLRRLTEEEAMAARRRRDSESSLSGLDSPSHGRGYRRGSDQRRAEIAAEQHVDPDRLPPLSPPNPAFARGKRAKDSAYYSGQPGQPGPASSVPGSVPGSMPGADQTVSSLASQESHGTWSGMSASPSGPDKGNESLAADNRRRRRQERRRAASSSRPTTAADMFD